MFACSIGCAFRTTLCIRVILLGRELLYRRARVMLRFRLGVDMEKPLIDGGAGDLSPGIAFESHFARLLTAVHGST